MSAISATNSSANNAIASLLSNAASSATDAGTPATNAAPSGSSASRDPADIVDLSDHVKATLARAKTEQVAADKLTAQLDGARDPDGKASAPKANSGDGASLFDKLSGRAQPQQPGNSPQSSTEFVSATLTALTEAAKRPDGSYGNYSAQMSDVFTPTSTSQQIDDWYKTTGQRFVESAQFFPDDFKTSLAQAVQTRQVTFQSAADIPDLNLHNTYTFEGGEGGGGSSAGYTYNRNAAIFQDPTTNYMVGGDGTVTSWAKTPASVKAASV
jgi:hypothetical protein